MIRTDNRLVALAFLMAALAGYVDALGFITMNGVFVSFMSGNSTRLAVDLALGFPRAAALAGGMIASFVTGVVAGSLVGARGGTARMPVLLLFVALLLAVAAGCYDAGLRLAALAVAAAAMGAENTVFARNGEVSFGVTYMTGTLVKMGQHLAAALTGGPAFGWVRYAMLWAGLVLGAAGGALQYSLLGLDGLWVASLYALLLTAVAWRMDTP